MLTLLENILLSEKSIGDLILCDPITREGVESLERLGLSINEVSPDYFYKYLRVASKFDKDENEIIEEESKKYESHYLYYQYTANKVQLASIKDRIKQFDLRFFSNARNEYPLLVLGVAGNGKSIEANRRIRDIKKDYGIESNSVYFDLESAFTKISYGKTYICPEETSLWLLCIKILNGIMQYIRCNHLLCNEIFENFNRLILKENLANQEQIKIFNNINEYRLGDNSTETRLFSSLLALLNSKQPEHDIKQLLELLLWIMYCSSPSKKQYLLLDNIEQYIQLDEKKIQILNSDISVIYNIINSIVTNLINDFDRIERDLGWKAFKIIIILRRTSLGLLDRSLLQSPVRGRSNTADVTGYFQVSEIWFNKKEFIWDKLLVTKYSSPENNKIIQMVDRLMNDNIFSIGMDYQSLIAPLMSYGIRRNARSQAHAAYNTYQLLVNGKKENIDYDDFEKLMSRTSVENSSVHYMFRRALVEAHFKWAISAQNQERWKKLNLGHLNGKKQYRYEGKKFFIEKVSYNDLSCVTLTWRILSFLSNFPEENTFTENVGKTVIDMFSTLSLYDLVEGVLINPTRKNKIKENDFLQLSKVLLSLSNMSYDDTKSAPYVILCIRDSNFHINTYESVLAAILKKIWDAGKEKSLPGEEYNNCDFGIRITDAGYSFLLDWQASFSFLASINCFTIPSLFFLKDVALIKYVIETVYNASLSLCERYETEAKLFCDGNDLTLKLGNYLPKHKNIPVTFKQRVRELHINHLLLYRRYLENNHDILGISKKDCENLTMKNSGYIFTYIAKYRDWQIGEGAAECF